MSDPAVKLTTEQRLMGLEIDGVRYDLAAPETFGLIAILRIDRMNDRLRYLLEEIVKEDAPPAVESELTEMLERFTASLMPEVPEAVRAKLTDQQRLSIVKAYRKWFSGPFAKTTGDSQSTRSSGGPGESQGSAGSSEAAATTG